MSEVPRQALVEYRLPLLGKRHTGEFTLSMAQDATILSLNEVLDWETRRYYRLSLFCLVELRNSYEERHFLVAGTGDRLALPEIWNHVGSVQSRSGYVWHLFEV